MKRIEAVVLSSFSYTREYYHFHTKQRMLKSAVTHSTTRYVRDTLQTLAPRNTVNNKYNANMQNHSLHTLNEALVHTI